jgi:hypothetical protein
VKSLDDMTEPELRDLFNRIARTIDDMLPEGTGFILLASPFGAHGVAQYVSNGSRPECIDWLDETAERLSREQDVPR